MKISNKNLGLIMGVFLFMILVYQLSLKKTIELRSLKKTISTQLTTFSNLENSYPLLINKNKNLEIILDKNNLSGDQSFSNNLFEKLTEYTAKNHVKITKFSKPHIFKYNATNTLYTYKIELTGDFKNLLQTAHQLEKTNLGSLVSQEYIKEKNYKTGLEHLNNVMLIQIIQ